MRATPAGWEEERKRDAVDESRKRATRLRQAVDAALVLLVAHERVLDLVLQVRLVLAQRGGAVALLLHALRQKVHAPLRRLELVSLVRQRLVHLGRDAQLQLLVGLEQQHLRPPRDATCGELGRRTRRRPVVR